MHSLFLLYLLFFPNDSVEFTIHNFSSLPFSGFVTLKYSQHVKNHYNFCEMLAAIKTVSEKQFFKESLMFY